MRLFVYNKYNQKIYLDLAAPTRAHLAAALGGEFFYIGQDFFSVNQVYAEVDNNDTISGAVLGGLVGLLGGPIGLLIGGVAGGLVGKNREDEETIKVKRFNSSRR